MSEEGFGVDPGRVLARALIAGIAIGAATGFVTGLAGLGPLVAVIGAFVGAAAALVPAGIGAAVIAGAARKNDYRRYRRTVIATLVVLGIGWALVTALWIAADALIGDVPPALSLVTVVVGLALAYRSILALAAVPPPLPPPPAPPPPPSGAF